MPATRDNYSLRSNFSRTHLVTLCNTLSGVLGIMSRKKTLTKLTLLPDTTSPKGVGHLVGEKTKVQAKSVQWESICTKRSNAVALPWRGAAP